MNFPQTSERKLGLPSFHLRASVVALLYAVAAGLWIWLSDSILARLVTDPAQFAVWQTYKGWFFVITSTLLLWSERVWRDRRVRATEKHLNERMQKRTSELERVRTQLQIILDYAPVSFAMRDIDDRYLLVNRRWEELMDISREFALGKTTAELFPEEVSRGLREAFARVLDKKEGIVEEVSMRLHGRDHVFVRASFPLYDEDGKPYAGIGLATDISAQKSIEESLRQAEARFRAIFQTVSVGINLSDPAGNYVSANPAFQRLVGYSEAELVGKNFRDITYPPDLVKDEMITKQIEQRPNETAVEEKRYVRADGSLVWVSLRISAICHSDGSFARYVTVAEEITERKRTDAALLASEERFSRMFYSNPYPTAYGGIMDGVLLDVNDRFADFFGTPRQKLIGRSIAHYSGLITREDRFRIFAALIRHGAVHDYELVLRRADGSLRDVLLSMYRLNFGTQEVTIGMFSDITERKQAEAEVWRLNQELEERVVERTAHLEQEIAERMRAETEVKALNVTLAEQAEHLVEANNELETFTYSVSHDLKAPLRGIDGYSRLLLEEYADRLDEEGQNFLNTIRRATTQMAQLIDDLLSYSRLERRTWAVSQVELHNMVETLLFQMQPAQVYPQTTIEVRLEPTMINTDADALAVVLRNLIDNALKFSAMGPAPCVEIGGESSGEGYRLFVRDNGVGFDMQYHGRIFEIFQRLHRSEDYPGTGIGLAIVRKALQRMNGRIWVESQPGQGATFTMEIPIL